MPTVNFTVNSSSASVEAVEAALAQEIANRGDALTAEASARTAAITSGIATEATARDAAVAAAVAAEVIARDAAVAQETTLRESALAAEVAARAAAVLAEKNLREAAAGVAIAPGSLTLNAATQTGLISLLDGAALDLGHRSHIRGVVRVTDAQGDDVATFVMSCIARRAAGLLGAPSMAIELATITEMAMDGSVSDDLNGSSFQIDELAGVVRLRGTLVALGSIVVGAVDDLAVTFRGTVVTL